jgi:hypothetical protein
VKGKNMLPVFGQAPPEPETTHEETGACSDDCCSESTADTPPWPRLLRERVRKTRKLMKEESLGAASQGPS